MKTICFISARNLGDAVLHAEFLKRLRYANKTNRLIVWTFEQARFLFEDLPNTKIVCSDFPMGASRRAFLRGGWRSFLAAVWHIRQIKPDELIDVIGDFRERIALRLICSAVMHSPEWETGHPFRNHARMLPFRAGQPMTIPASEISIYSALTLMLHALAPSTTMDFRLPHRTTIREGQALQIGLHLFASASFKLWPQENWETLVSLLNTRFPGSSFTLFGAPTDLPILEQFSTRLNVPYCLFTASLREFKTQLANIDLLFGLDSFSVHMAHSQGVPTVVLVGANDPRIFTPPGSVAVTHPGRCKFQPCNGTPHCVGSTFQYSCMIDISPEDALCAISSLDSKNTSITDKQCRY